MIKLSDYVFKFLADYGVKDLFMLSGGGCMHLVNSVGVNQDITYHCCLFEQAVSLAADAYAQYNNDIGVGLVTTGPGGTNAITGVAEAFTDSIPLLMISGQVKRSDISHQTVRTLGFQELDIVSVVKPITKYAVTVMEPEKIAYELGKCIYMAKEGRPGPVWLDIPLDVQAAMVDEKMLVQFNPPIKEKQKELNAQIEKLIEMINKAKRPVFLAGYGVKLSGAQELFNKIAERLQIPILLTWKAMDLMSEDNPLYYGRPGCIGQRAANFIQQNSDLIITVGARLDFGQIGYNHDEFASKAKKVIVDVDQKELEKFSFKIDLSICEDAKVFLEALYHSIEDITVSDVQVFEWKEYCAKLKEKYPVITSENCNYKEGTSSYFLMKILAEVTDENVIFVPGNSGACSEVFCQAYPVQNGQRVITANTLGSMGTGLPMSIGACIASGKKTTICVNGDGGFQMNIQDLETIKRLNLPIKFFVLNNAGYGSIRNSQDNYFNSFYVGAESGSGVTIPNIERIAYGYDIHYLKLSSNAEIRDNIKNIIFSDGPMICEMMVSEDEKTLPRTKSVVTQDGSMESHAFEDLFPFLSTDEFEQNMKISQL